LGHDGEGFAGITGALTTRVTEAFELATMLEKEVRSTALLRESAHRIAVDADHLRTQVQRLEEYLADRKAKN
jgi:hypothetical protein